MARPSKIDRFIEEAEKVLANNSNLSNKELLSIINENMDGYSICRKTIQNWKSSGSLSCIGIYPNPNNSKTTIKFNNQAQYQREYYHKVKKGDINHRIRNAFASNLRHHLKKKNKKTFECLGYSVSELMIHLEGLFEEGMNWDNYGVNGWHIDHITPASWFFYKSEECKSFKECWSLSNLQPKWAHENRSKQNRYIG